MRGTDKPCTPRTCCHVAPPSCPGSRLFSASPSPRGSVEGQVVGLEGACSLLLLDAGEGPDVALQLSPLTAELDGCAPSILLNIQQVPNEPACPRPCIS